MKMAAITNSEAFSAEIVQDALAENKILGTMFGTKDQLSQTVKHIRKTKQNEVPDIDIDGHSFVCEELNEVSGVFQCSICKKVCKDYRGLKIHHSLAHKFKKQKYCK